MQSIYTLQLRIHPPDQNIRSRRVFETTTEASGVPLHESPADPSISPQNRGNALAQYPPTRRAFPFTTTLLCIQDAACASSWTAHALWNAQRIPPTASAGTSRVGPATPPAPPPPPVRLAPASPSPALHALDPASLFSRNLRPFRLTTAEKRVNYPRFSFFYRFLFFFGTTNSSGSPCRSWGKGICVPVIPYIIYSAVPWTPPLAYALRTRWGLGGVLSPRIVSRKGLSTGGQFALKSLQGTRKAHHPSQGSSYPVKTQRRASARGRGYAPVPQPLPHWGSRGFK